MLLDEDVFGKKEPVLIREFREEESLNDTKQLFDDASIPYAVFDSDARFDVTFAYDKSHRSLKIYVPDHFAKKARALCDAEDRAIIERLPKDYYLFSFTNDELKAIIVKSFEWSPLDVSLAKALLKERGENPESEDLLQQEEAAKITFDSPEKMSGWTLFWGYFFSVLGGWIGIFFVAYILTSKKTTHEGVKMARFDTSSKKQAYYMIFIIVLVNALAVVYRLNSRF